MINRLCGIYVIHFNRDEENVFKIGSTRNINVRIKSFNTTCFGELELVKFYQVEDLCPLLKIEKFIHNELSKYRINQYEFFRVPNISVIDEAFLKSEEEYITPFIKIRDGKRTSMLITNEDFNMYYDKSLGRRENLHNLKEMGFIVTYKMLKHLMDKNKIIEKNENGYISNNDLKKIIDTRLSPTDNRDRIKSMGYNVSAARIERLMSKGEVHGDYILIMDF